MDDGRLWLLTFSVVACIIAVCVLYPNLRARLIPLAVINVLVSAARHLYQERNAGECMAAALFMLLVTFVMSRYQDRFGVARNNETYGMSLCACVLGVMAYGWLAVFSAFAQYLAPVHR